MRKGMDTRIRYILASLLGASSSVLVWYLVASSHLIFSQLGASGLVPSVFASVVGGFVTASISPDNKIKMSAIIGFCVSLPMLLYLLNNGLSHHGRNPFFWYWPIYIFPLFCIGGLLGRGVWRHA